MTKAPPFLMKRRRITTKTKTAKETKTKRQKKRMSDKMPTIERVGEKIILPPGMSYAVARDWLTKQEQAEEQLVKIYDQIPCFPLDGMIALKRAFEEKFGFVTIEGKGWWGPEPPLMFQITTPTGVETAPFGNIKAPRWEGGYLGSQFSGPSIVVNGQVKKKFEAECKSIITRTRELLAERSIYRGQAIHVDLHWWDGDDEQFHPINDAPKFMDISPTDMILNETTEFELSTSVYMIIEQSELCRKNRIPLKHGILLKGPFGTGKTLCAKVLAKKCVDSQWTFIYLAHAAQLSNGLKLAKMYAPACLFAEDVDTVVKERDDQMNDLLNVLDGIDTKDTPIVLVLTTNNADQIDPSFLRAGRMDTVVHFGPPDGETSMKFIQHYAGKLLAADQDLQPVGDLLQGLVPAFIRETVNKATRYTMYREKTAEIAGKMVASDLEKAAQAVLEHRKMMEGKKPSEFEVIAHATRTVHEYGVRGKVLPQLVEKQLRTS